MIALDLTQETPPSGSKLIVEPSDNKSRGKISFEELLTTIKNAEKSTFTKSESHINRSSSSEQLSENLISSEQKKGDFTFDDLLKGTAKEDNSVQNSTLLRSLNTKEETNKKFEDTLVASKKEEDIELEAESKLDKLISSDKKDINSKLEQTLISSKEIKIDSKIEQTFVSAKEIEINPKLKETLSTDELKIVMKDAKEYLKKQILSSEGFKRSEIQNLPQTLKGLTQIAQKLGIDVSKITLEEVDIENKLTFNKDTKSDTSTKKTLSMKDSGKIESDNLLLNSKKTTTIEKTSSIQTQQTFTNNEQKEHSKTEQYSSVKELKSTPLFNAQTTKEISTEQLVNTKVLNRTNTQEKTTSKNRVDDTLKLLLQGQKAAKQEGSTLTNDFSVATAKVLAPENKSENKSLFESLLRPQDTLSDEKSDTSSLNSTKSESLNIAKADSFEVKINEAKQMIKYLSQDVKQAIDDYKAPFTRVKVQLNPQQLGEVELTVVQRGKNLHVNLSSNNAAINTLAMNANDLKIQLQNSGINNASLNFSNNSQGGEAANSGQNSQQQQNREQAHNEYNYFDNEEQNEEIISSLEIIVPNYA